MPSTNAGRCSAGLIGLFVALVAVFAGLVASGQRGGETFFSNLWLTVPGLGAAIAAIAAGCCGVSAWRHHDRSVVVVVAIILGALVALWTGLELAFPH